MVLVEGVNQVSSDEFESLISNKKVHLLDVREQSEYDSGRINGSILVPATRFDEEFEKLKLKKSDIIALYCRSGNRSDFIAKRLVAAGYKKVFNLEMGIEEWQAWGKKLI